MLSYAIPGLSWGSATSWPSTQGLQLTGTGLIIILGVHLRAMPVGIRSGMAALAQIDPSLEEASVCPQGPERQPRYDGWSCL